jgi:hypothetical protein
MRNDPTEKLPGMHQDMQEKKGGINVKRLQDVSKCRKQREGKRYVQVVKKYVVKKVSICQGKY